jgi:hypothetical protein
VPVPRRRVRVPLMVELTPVLVRPPLEPVAVQVPRPLRAPTPRLMPLARLTRLGVARHQHARPLAPCRPWPGRPVEAVSAPRR